MKRIVIGTFAALALIVAPVAFIANKQLQSMDVTETNEQTRDLVSVVMPAKLGDGAEMGQKVFQARCAACHGLNGQGVDGNGPPLIHKIYEPSHHGDAAFQRAAEIGVRSHHWPYGDMPPVAGVTKADIDAVIRFVREVQRANGIM